MPPMTQTQGLAFVAADPPPGNTRGATVAVRRVTDERGGRPAAWVMIGGTQVVISDPASLQQLATAFADLADEADLAAQR